MMNYKNIVTIGIPVFNEIENIERCLKSCVQSNVIIIISDNASTDGTNGICENFSKKYSNIQLITQKENKGAQENFKILLEQCKTEYFMWLGAHDEISEDYILNLKLTLELNPEIVMAYGDAVHMDLSTKRIVKQNNYREFSVRLNDEQADVRSLSIISQLNDCTLIHGLWRVKSLKNAWVNDKILGSDHLLLLNAALSGRFQYVSGVTYKRGHPARNNSKILQMQRITGKCELSASKEQLCRLSLDALKKSNNLSEPRLTQIKAGWMLAYRFGSYSKSHAWKALQKFVYFMRVVNNFKTKKLLK